MVSLEDSPLAEMTVTVGLDMVAVVLSLVVATVEFEVVKTLDNFALVR